MTLNRLTDDLAVAGQIEAADVPTLAAKGIRSIVCNRPDGEAPNQPPHGDVEKAAKAAGVVFVYQPIVSGAMTREDAVIFGQTLEKLPKPVLAYCRSGTRCTALWAMSEAGKRPVDDILARTQRAGYDMTPLLPQLERS